MSNYGVAIIADSIAPNGKRLITWELTYPRFIHAELMTHRVFSRNAASSRAIPNKKLRSKIAKNPVVPLSFGANQKGMQAGVELSGWRRKLAEKIWSIARWPNLFFSWILGSLLGVHKQTANRLVESHMAITVLVTATEFDNWFRLRTNENAQPEIRWVAEQMQVLYREHKPKQLAMGDWHLPFIGDDDVMYSEDEKKRISVARCARVSYLTHDGRRNYQEDVRLADALAKNGHWSPYEHVAQAQPEGVFSWSGNFCGWHQYREDVDPDFQKRE